MIKDILHYQIVKYYKEIQEWFLEKSKNLSFPFYSSFDLRDSCQKIAPVDANLFPAGFNNICYVDQENAPLLVTSYLKKYHPTVQTIILLTEEHTHNLYYWDNIYLLKMLLEHAGQFNVLVCVPGKNISKEITITSAKGQKISVLLLKEHIKKADIIISNNDFSTDYGLDFCIPVIPTPNMGWRQRRKHVFFEKYNQLAHNLAQLIKVDPTSLSIHTKRFTGFNPQDPQCLEKLKTQVDMFFHELEPVYKKWNQKPYVFLKNNAGTYGLGMTTISSAQDIENWNYKIRKKMKTAKGNRPVTELILQEGIMSHLKTEGAVTEPVIYLIGQELMGGFLRAHKSKGARDNLNSPGAIYRTLCISDLEIEVEGRPMENVYGWIARLAGLAVAEELKINQ